MSTLPWKTKLIPLLSLGALTVVITLVFQNCGNARFGQDTSDANSLNSLQNCTDPNCTNIINGTGSCSFNGQTIQDGDTITAYLNSSGASCVSESRTCDNGVLSGSYAYASCSPSTANSCLFNGQTIADGGTVTAYLSSNPGSGQSCQSEVRSCHDGALSGSYLFASCTPSSAGSCLFNGQTIQSGSGVFAYKTSTVPSDQVCQVEFRLCANGQMSGSNTFASCSIDAPAACIFNGQTVASGSAVVGYQNSSAPAGGSCVYEARVCNNGTLTGSYNYSSCNVAAPAACLFDGLTIPSGTSVVAYLASTVGPNETCQTQSRSCSNGSLSGTYAFASCTSQTPASCQFNGQTVAHGDTRTAFKTSTVPAGDSCEQESRVCDNGVMSGSYTFASCSPAAPASCRFDDRDVASGEIVLAYKKRNLGPGEDCEGENRKCLNGVLSGSFTFASCGSPELRTCDFNGQSIRSGSSVTAYRDPQVPYGQSCINSSESRTCFDGNLSGSFTNATCTVAQPTTCSFNGRSIANGASVTVYSTAQVNYGQTCDSVKSTRTCSDGVLSGSGTIESCTVKAGASCTLDGQTYAHGASVDAYSAKTVVYGNSCSSIKQSRTCTNGSWSGSANYAYVSCSVGTAASCKLGDGTVVAHGASKVAYASSTVPFSGNCSGVTRTCNNGVLSGSGEYASCTKAAARSCVFGGRTIAHGGSATGYTQALVGYGASCGTVTRVCNDGTMSNPSAEYASCGPRFKWINVSYSTTQKCIQSGGGSPNGGGGGTRCSTVYNVPTHAATCSGAGMKVAADQGDGICASGERRPLKATGISYWLGVWPNATPNVGGTVVNTGYGLECYANGQKQDHDKTDKIVAYLCSY